MTSYYTLQTAGHIQEAIIGPFHWSVWARIPGRDDVRVWSPDGVRELTGQLQINAGEWSPSANRYEGAYLNEEWLTPRFVFLRHKCEGCHYPPNMCCLQVDASVPIDPDFPYLGEEWDSELEAEILNSEEYDEAVGELDRTPPGVVIVNE